MSARPTYKWMEYYTPNWRTKTAHFKKGEIKKVIPLAVDVRCSRVPFSDDIKSTRTFQTEVNHEKGLSPFYLLVNDKGEEIYRQPLQIKNDYYGPFTPLYFEEIVLKEPAKENVDVNVEFIVGWKEHGEKRDWKSRILIDRFELPLGLGIVIPSILVIYIFFLSVRAL